LVVTKGGSASGVEVKVIWENQLSLNYKYS